MDNQKQAEYNREEQKILAEIEITRADLYVFRESKEKDRWADLLDKAESVVQEKPEYSKRLNNRVNEVIGNLWKRIFDWKEFQRKVIKYFIFIILGELILISVYYYFVDIVRYGFYTSIVFGLLGGTLGVVLNLGKDLKVEESNQLKTMKLILRPLIGSVSGVALYSLLRLNIVAVSLALDQGFVLIVLSISAGYSERFISKALNDYTLKIFNK
ncbi:hypothetical protein HQ544_01075 [Candidatus Falkowbacteria bacterium]|nr:hypothetical protein [Candidatus Falkowbacteria bacterium]